MKMHRGARDIKREFIKHGDIDAVGRIVGTCTNILVVCVLRCQHSTADGRENVHLST